MRVLLLNQHYPPDSGATGRLMADLAGGLCRRGHRITVLTGRPSYPEARHLRVASQETLDGVEVVRVPTAPRRESALGRGLHYGSFAVVALLRGLTLPRPDVILAWSATPIFGGVAALALARAKGCPLVWGVQDVHPEISCAIGALREGLVARGMRCLESIVWRGADRVVVIADDLRPAARARGVPEERLVTIRNWADPRRIVPRERSAFRHELGIRDDEFVVQYAGNFGRAQDLETVLEAAAVAGHANDRVRLLLVGAGSRTESLARRVETVPGARIVRFQPDERVDDVLAAADLSLVPLRRGLTRWCVPSKLYSILASGRPVGAILDSDSEVARVVTEGDCGFRVDPGDVAGLAREILRLASDPDGARRLGANARAFLEREGTLARALDEYEDVLRGAGTRSRRDTVPPTKEGVSNAGSPE